MQKSQDHDRLDNVRQLLRLETFSAEEHKKTWDEEYQKLYYNESFDAMQGSEIDTFKTCKEYVSWASSENACLLVLSGYNDFATDHCWLSPMAMDAVNESNHQNNFSFCAYYTVPRQGKLLYEVLPVILLQLLAHKPNALRDQVKYDELCSELRKLQRHQNLKISSGKHKDDIVSAMEMVALRTIDFFGPWQTVTIIIDRTDRCWDRDRIDHRKAILKTFAKMVKAAKTRLKIMAVVDESTWPVQKQRADLEEGGEGRVIIHVPIRANDSSSSSINSY